MTFFDRPDVRYRCKLLEVVHQVEQLVIVYFTSEFADGDQIPEAPCVLGRRIVDRDDRFEAVAFRLEPAEC